MKKLTIPSYDAIATYDLCVNEVSAPILNTAFTSNRGAIELANISFDAAKIVASWANLPRVPRGNPNVVIAGTLNKGQLMTLYTDHMVKTKGPSRNVYDNLLTAAGGLCPFCGGLGHAGTLDHYLPKANFPAYSVHPHNLVPCCRDCNSGKNASFGAELHEQTIHPYFDIEHFFDQRWIVAIVHKKNPILVQFRCRPPENWSVLDQGRVRSHFDGYNLGYRFSVQAGSEVSKVVQLRKSSLQRLDAQDFRAYLIDNANSTDFVLNGWSRTMYTALAATEWFIETDFQDPNWHQVP